MDEVMPTRIALLLSIFGAAPLLATHPEITTSVW